MSLEIQRPDRFSSPPTAVLFDLDNTFYAYDPPHDAGMAAVRKKAHQLVGCSEEVFAQYFDRARHEVKEQVKRTGASHSRLLYFHRMLELLGMKSQALMALDLEQTYWRTFLGAAQVFDEAKEFLDELRLANITTGMVTDQTTQMQFRKLIYFGLDHAFDSIVTSEEAGEEKSGGRPYLLINQKMNLGNQVVWMVGDNAEADIRSSREHLGALTLQKRHAGVKIGQGKAAPDVVFDTFGDLRRLLSKVSRDLLKNAPRGGIRNLV